MLPGSEERNGDLVVRKSVSEDTALKRFFDGILGVVCVWFLFFAEKVAEQKQGWEDHGGQEACLQLAAEEFCHVSD